MIINIEKEDYVTAKINFAKRAHELIKANDFRSYPTIKNLISETNNGIVLTVLSALIKDFSKSFNVVRNITENQVIEVCVILISQYEHLTIEDCIVLLEFAKSGRLTTVRDRIDVQVLLEIITAYDEYRFPKKHFVI